MHFNHSSPKEKCLLRKGDLICGLISVKTCNVHWARNRRVRGARVDVTFAGLHDSSLRHCSSSLVKTSERKPSVPVQNESMRLYITPSSLVTSTQLLQYSGHVTQLLAGQQSCHKTRTKRGQTSPSSATFINKLTASGREITSEFARTQNAIQNLKILLNFSRHNSATMQTSNFVIFGCIA